MKRLRIDKIPSEQVQRIAEDIYIYGYPLVLMDVRRRSQTATAYASFETAPQNQFAHTRSLPTGHERHLVHPVADGLRSSAWMHLGKEPVVLTLPPTERYYLVSCFSGWYEIFETFSPRIRGVHGGKFGFTGPRWSGRLPAGVKRIAAPTETVWLDCYFAVAPVEDVQAVHELQDELRLTPLSEWGSSSIPHTVPFRPRAEQETAPQDQVAAFGAREFYTRLAKLLQNNPAQVWDAPLLAEFVHIGFFPGEEFLFEMLPTDTIEAMQRAVSSAHSRIKKAEEDAGRNRTGEKWFCYAHPGSYELNYLHRAAAAFSGVPSVLGEDLVSYATSVDQAGEPLKGVNEYVINFQSDVLPPVNAFWSITLYDSRQGFFPNDIHRYVIGDRDRLRFNSDRSLSILVQHQWPGAGLDSNWLPAPKAAFSLVLKMYWPKPEVIRGIWRPPAVKCTN